MFYHRGVDLIHPRFAAHYEVKANEPAFLTGGWSYESYCMRCQTAVKPLLCIEGGLIETDHFHPAENPDDAETGIYFESSNSSAGVDIRVHSMMVSWLVILEPQGPSCGPDSIGRCLTGRTLIKEIKAYCQSRVHDGDKPYRVPCPNSPLLSGYLKLGDRGQLYPYCQETVGNDPWVVGTFRRTNDRFEFKL